MRQRHRFTTKGLILLRILILTLWTSQAFAWGGNLKSITDYYPDDLGEPTKPIAPYLQVEASDKHRLIKRWRFQWRVFGLTNPESQHSPEKLYGDVPEAFFEWRKRSTKIRLGMNTVNWSVVDISSPSDQINMTALMHPLRITKRGAPMLEFQKGSEELGIHVVYIPRQRRPVLPSEDSRWLPRSLLLNVPGFSEIVLPDTLEYKFQDELELDHARDHNFGIRLHSNQGSFDFQVTYTEGASKTPKIVPTVVVVDPGPPPVVGTPIYLEPQTYRVRTTGAGMVWAGENVIMRAETAYQSTISKASYLQPWSWASAIAMETGVPIGTGTLTLLAQFYYTLNPQAADNMISSAYRLFDRTVLAGGRWTVSDDLTINFSSLIETKSKGLFWQVGFEQKLKDSLKWGLAWRDFSASQDGLLKTFERNDHATLELSYFF